VKKEKHSHHEPMSMKRKKEDGTGTSVPPLPSCSKCGATLDLEVIEAFGSMRIASYYDGKSYYCNNPLCAPDEEQQKHRLLPFSWWNN
jgi:hypothetical protein